MTFNLADPMPFQPWYFIVLAYCAAISVFYIAVSISCYISAKLKDNGARGLLSIAIARTMRWGLLVYFFVWVIAVVIMLFYYGHINEQYKEWQEVRTEASLVTILLGAFGFLGALALLQSTARLEVAKEQTLIIKKGKRIAIAVQVLDCSIPFGAAYLIGPNYSLSKHYITVMLLVSAILVVSSWVSKSPMASSTMRWGSLIAITSLFLFVIAQPVVVHLQLPEAQSYCQSLIAVLEKQRRQNGNYPITLDAISLTGIRKPHLVKQASIGFYHCDSDTQVYSFHLYQDPWVSYVYSSDTKKWQVWKSNLWY
jgi:hypothetical protein